MSNPTNTIFEAKRFIARKYNAIKTELKLMPFSMTKDSQPKYEMQVGTGQKYVSPVEVSAIKRRRRNTFTTRGKYSSIEIEIRY